ncbi:MAG: ACP S-malonyltransferase [Candidatus Eisenbacteria bacterium]|nr:ACP S-malonyltransferase [Candidatus Eisenbacteria bacterium]
MDAIALFPGQGSQAVGMGAALAAAFPEARAVFEQADEVLGFGLSTLAFEGPDDELKLTRNTQPAILMHSMAVLTVLKARGYSPSAAAGHSLGEYSAYVAAGSLTFEDALRLVRRRGELMFEAGVARPGAMAAILGLEDPAVAEICRDAATVGIVVPANRNSPGQVVLSGEVAGVERAMELASARGARVTVRLPVSGAFHSPLMESAAEGLSEALRRVDIRDAVIPVVANQSSRPVTTSDEIRLSLERQLLGAVRWEESMRWLLANVGTRMVEVGPGRVLKGLMRSIDRTAVVASVEDPEGVQAFLAPEGKAG